MNEVFAKNLTAARENKPKRTQEKVAADLGITRSAYGSYEEGRAFPPSELLIRIADYFGIADLKGFISDDEFQPSRSMPKVRDEARPHKLTLLQRAYENAHIKDKLAVNLLLGLVDLSDPS